MLSLLTLLKNHMNYLKGNIFEFFFKKKNFFFTIYNDEKSKA